MDTLRDDTEKGDLNPKNHSTLCFLKGYFLEEIYETPDRNKHPQPDRLKNAPRFGGIYMYRQQCDRGRLQTNELPHRRLYGSFNAKLRMSLE